MLILSLYRIIKFAFQNFFRNIWLSVVTVTIIVMSLFVMTVLVALNVVVQDTVTDLREKIDISVYFKNNTSAEHIQVIRDNLEQLSIVRQTQLISKEEALNTFRFRYQDNPVINQSLDALEVNPLGDILIIKADGIEQYRSILELLREDELQQYIQESDFSDFQTIIERINDVSLQINRIGIVVSLIFIVIALLVVFNTIRMAIYTHREEIAIMRLVGATRWFIQAPFLLEALMYAVIAVGLNILVLFPVLEAAQPFIGGFFGPESMNLAQYFRDNFVQVFGVEFGLILLLNLISSMIAIRKYINV